MAALAAGERMVRDEFAPAWWPPANAAGNEAKIATTLFAWLALLADQIVLHSEADDFGAVHHYIHHDDVGQQRRDKRESFRPAGRLAYYFNVFSAGEEEAQPAAHDGMVINQEHPYL